MNEIMPHEFDGSWDNTTCAYVDLRTGIPHGCKKLATDVIHDPYYRS